MALSIKNLQSKKKEVKPVESKKEVKPVESKKEVKPVEQSTKEKKYVIKADENGCLYSTKE